eukprot:scaffold390_cov115-Isochrysis_galbana.AAC.4
MASQAPAVAPRRTVASSEGPPTSFGKGLAVRGGHASPGEGHPPDPRCPGREEVRPPQVRATHSVPLPEPRHNLLGEPRAKPQTRLKHLV